MQDYKVDLHLNTKPAQATIAALDKKIKALKTEASKAVSVDKELKAIYNAEKAAAKASNKIRADITKSENNAFEYTKKLKEKELDVKKKINEKIVANKQACNKLISESENKIANAISASNGKAFKSNDKYYASLKASRKARMQQVLADASKEFAAKDKLIQANLNSKLQADKLLAKTSNTVTKASQSALDKAAIANKAFYEAERRTAEKTALAKQRYRTATHKMILSSATKQMAVAKKEADVAVAEAKRIATAKARITELGSTNFGKITSGQIKPLEAEVSKLNTSLSKMKTSMSANEYETYSAHLDKASTSLKKLKNNADFGYSSLRKFWERFGKVALGFSVMYTGMRLVSGAFMQLGSIIKEGIQQAGEMVAIQAKLAMWYALSTDTVGDYAESFTKARANVEALADASVTSLSSLSELGTALDEIGQASVGLGVENLDQFASLVDFTILIAKTTDSSLKQVRQEFQALMQGQVKATNILIRTAVHMGMISDDQLKALKNQTGRLEVMHSIMGSIHEVWQKVKKEMISADINTGLKMWYDTLVRIVSKSEELASKKAGKTSIFGTTAFEHFDKLQIKLKGLTSESTGLMNVLNAGFGTVLTSIEDLMDGIFKLGDVLWNLKDSLVPLAKIGGAGIAGKAVGSLFGIPHVGIITALAVAIDHLVVSLTDLKKGPVETGFDYIAGLLKEAGSKIWGGVTGRVQGKTGFFKTAGLLTETGIYTASVDELKKDIAETQTAIDDLETILASDGFKATAFGSGYIEEIAALSLHLDTAKTRLKQIKDPIKKAKDSLAEFVKETKDLNGILKGLKFDPITAMTSAVSKGRPDIVKLLLGVTKESISDELENIKTQIASLEPLVNNPKYATKAKAAIAAYALEQIKLEDAQKKVNTAMHDANLVLYDQSKVVHDLAEERNKLEAALSGTTTAYEETIKYESTLESLEKSRGTALSVPEKEKLKALLENIAALKTDINVRKLASEWEISEHAEALARFQELDTARQASTDKQTQSIDSLSEAYYSLYADSNTQALDALNKQAFDYEAFVQGNEEATQEFLDWKKLAFDKYYESIGEKETDWKKGVKDGLQEINVTSKDFYSQTKNIITEAFSNMTDALTDFVMTGKISFSDFAESIIKDMVKMQIQAQVTAPLASGLSSIAGSIGNSLVNAYYGNVSAVGSAGPLPQAKGNVFQSPSLHEYANTVQTSPKMFAFAQGGVFAEAEPEAVMPLERTSDGKLGVTSSGATGNTYNTYNIDASNAQNGVEEAIITALKDLNNNLEKRALKAVVGAANRGGSFAKAVGRT